jgi:hypothetical protein
MVASSFVMTRAASLTAEERRTIAAEGARIRWGKVRKKARAKLRAKTHNVEAQRTGTP